MRGSLATKLFRLPCQSSQCRAPRVSPLPIQSLAFSSMLCPGSKFIGQSGRSYRSIRPLGPQRIEIAPNIWTAVDDVDESEQFVVKEPSSDDDGSLGWSLFQHEFEMQKLFTGSAFIRQMIDFVPSVAGAEPKIVLEAFEKTLWTARTQRDMTSKEIKWIMKAVIIGLWTVHRKGLVYSDLKMENVVLNGFNNKSPGDHHSIITRLADCGAITKPSNREITSISYRSPEVYFGKPWTASTDIWSWGIMYCHLLEAQADISKPGMYDSICKGSLEDKAQAVRTAMAFDFKLHSIPYYTDDEQSWTLLPPKDDPRADSERWAERLLRKGVVADDIEFLFLILNPDPAERWTAEDIVSCGYLEVD